MEEIKIENELFEFARDTIEYEMMMADRERLNFGIHDDLLDFESRTSILPIYVSKSETEAATEIILCSAVSGLNSGKNGMPKEITITRKLLNGEEYNARYVMKKGD